ncbi:NAD-dependent DNA ligase LigA [Anaeromusa acidaminophila]|uniref:NAD-dependent DNA ligase LigA n=1 Tax=Anaeromusa acidaminophila TaxID=81464 RepID=UPI0003813A28|nr:NAD-dependent DNA ligase LigA [Anaeromusa acidaminophila]
MNSAAFKQLTTEEQKTYLDSCNTAYYDNDAPVIADELYDLLKDMWLRNAGLEEYEQVPGETAGRFEKFNHWYPVLSLAKINTKEALRAELARLAPGVIEPKFDGLTVMFYPDKTAVTRGTGHIGEIINNTANKISSLGRCHDTYPIRIEGLMRWDAFYELQKKREAEGEAVPKNPRNACAGMLRNKDAGRVEGVSYFAYNLAGDTRPETTQLEELKALGWQVTPFFSFSHENLEEAVQYVLDFDRAALPYMIDGLVIKSNKENAAEEFGMTGHHTKNMVAYKFPSEGQWTTLKEVIWQVGREKITPVGILEPVDIGGVSIERVSLHNLGVMDSLQLSQGCEVFVIRSNDVIPDIIESRQYDPLKKFEAPSVCPECCSRLQQINDQHFCINTDCRGKLLQALCHMAKREALDIEGLSEETAAKMIGAGVEHITDIFDLTQTELKQLPGFAEKSAAKLFTAIQNARRTELKRFLYAGGIVGIGRSISNDVAGNLGTFEAIMEDIEQGCKRIAAIPGVGPVAVQALLDNKQMLIKMREKIEPATAEKIISNENALTFVITGTLTRPRSYYEEQIKKAGHKVSGSVSKKTSYLLAGEDSGSKLIKAQELGVSIVKESELESLL